MKKLCTIIFFFSLFFISVCLPSDAPALMRIVEDPSAVGVTMSFAEQDDPDDTTPPFSPDNYYITINNHSRRYVGVCIDQAYNGTTSVVDNGQDDRFMRPATEIFSYKTLIDFFKDLWSGTAPEPPPASRVYALSVPGELPYGSEIRFPIRVVGPAWLKRLPLPLEDPLRCYGEDVTGTTIATDIHMLLLPLFSQLTGAATDNDMIQIIMNDFLFNFGILHIEVTNAMADGEVYVVMENIVKYVVGSEQMQKFFKNDSNKILGKIKDILLTPVALAEALNVFLHLASDQWLYRFEVRIVRPKIDYLQPDMGLPGSTVAITGVGFDPEFGTEPKNNRVFFRNASGGEVEATEVKTFDEKLLKVTDPEGAVTGPVKVCTGSPPSMGTVSTLCSNEDVIFTVGLEPKLSIISPVDGTTVSGAVDISLELKNPPSPFPPSEAQLFVDSQPSGRMAVSSPTFIFAFDTSGLAVGEHSIEVWLNLGGEIYTSLPLLLFVKAEEPSGPRLTISAPSPDQHFYKNQPITVTAEILNGPIPSSSSETIDYTLSVNGNAWSYKSLKPYTSYPGCYNVTFSLEDLELQGENVLSVRAVGKNGTLLLYDLSASVKIWGDATSMEYSSPMEISGCIDSKSPIILLFPWPDHSKVIDQAFSFGTCGPDSTGKYGNYMVEVGFEDKMTSPVFGTYYITRNSFIHQALSNKPFRFYTAGTASNPTIYIESSIYDLPSDNCSRLPANQSECKIYNYTKEWCDGIDCWPEVSIIDNPCTADPYYPDTSERFKIKIYSFGKHPCAYYVSER